MTIRWFAALGAVAMAGAIPAQAAAPSFSCRGALRADERAICRSPLLSRQDRELSSAYLAIRHCKGMGGRDLFIGEQARWLKQRSACGSSTRCLSKLYSLRLAELRPIATRAREFMRRQECPAL